MLAFEAGTGFDIIVADPPWRFAANSDEKPGKGARRHYPTMRLDAIKALDVAAHAAPASILYLWATSPMLPQALDVMAAWGWRYVSSIVWRKSRIATGYWVRGRHEIVLIGKRGRFPCPRPAPHPDSVIEAPTMRHSAKPGALQDQIDAAWPHSRKLELFARSPRAGWALWGNEAPE